jgi:hypothetical protein
MKMSYIIKHSFGEDGDYYVRLKNNTSFEEVYDPSYATLFETEDEANKWINTYSSKSEYSKVVSWNREYKKYLKWAREGTVRRQLFCINQSMSRPYNNESLTEIIDWHIYRVNNVDSIKYEHFKTWPSLHSCSKHLWCVEAYLDRESSIRYLAFEIFTNKNGKFKDFEKELNMVIDKATYKDYDDYLIFPIFDHYLSEYGNKEKLKIHPVTRKVEGFDSLESFFEYMKKERYYNR